MVANLKIVVFSGSTRKESFNRKVAAAAARSLHRQGAEVQLIDLALFEAPVYNGDIEVTTGLPETMSALKKIISDADAMVISTPEYNGCVPPLLVNIFCWVSRSVGDEKSNAAFAGKKAAILAASPGGLGGVRVIPRLRDCLSELGVMVVPGFVTVRSASSAFAEDGTFKDPANADAVDRHMSSLLASGISNFR